VNRGETTLERINRLAEERYQLYRKGGRSRLSRREMQRINEIDRELEQLWRQHRQELATRDRWQREWILEKKAA